MKPKDNIFTLDNVQLNPWAELAQYDQIMNGLEVKPKTEIGAPLRIHTNNKSFERITVEQGNPLQEGYDLNCY